MVGVKELYLCQSLEELQEQAGTGDMSLIPAKRLCESSQKVFKTAQLEQDLGESSLKVFKTAHIEQD